MIQLGDFTLYEAPNLFNMERKQTVPYEFEDNVQFMVMIERNLDLLKVERRVSTLSDLMSDVGGFFGLLVMFGRTFSRLWNFNSFNNFLVTRLYKVMKPSEQIEGETSYFDRSEFISRSYMPQCLTFLCRYRTRKEIAMNKAREKLN